MLNYKEFKDFMDNDFYELIMYRFDSFVVENFNKNYKILAEEAISLLEDEKQKEFSKGYFKNLVDKKTYPYTFLKSIYEEFFLYERIIKENSTESIRASIRSVEQDIQTTLKEQTEFIKSRKNELGTVLKDENFKTIEIRLMSLIRNSNLLKEELGIVKNNIESIKKNIKNKISEAKIDDELKESLMNDYNIYILGEVDD